MVVLIMGRRQVVSQRFLVPLFRRFESYRPSLKLTLIDVRESVSTFVLIENLKGAFCAEGASCLLYMQRSS